MYLLIGIGLLLAIWPGIIKNSGGTADSHSVVSAILGAVGLLSLLGVRYPIKMLPILIFELLWKSIWLIAFALPMHLNGGLDDYAKGNLFAVGLGVVLTPLVIPWGFFIRNYIRAPSDA